MQGCHYLLDVKCKDFSMTFQDLLKKIQDLFYQLKPERFTHGFQNKLYHSALLNWLILTMKNNQWQVTVKIRPCEVVLFILQCCCIKNILSNSIFLLFFEIKKEVFCPFQDFQGPRPKFKDFPGPGNFFPQLQDFPGFSRSVATL